jgi:SAM-dependent methyltransferase
MKDWSLYHQAVGNTPNSLVELVLRNHLGQRLRAFDLGAGNMRDAKFLLQQGFKEVTAVDEDPAAETFVVPGIDFKCQSITKYKLAKNSFDLGISCNTLLYLSFFEVSQVLEIVYKGLRPGGIFGCNLLGMNDDWVRTYNPRVSFLQLADVKVLKEKYRPLKLESTEWDALDSNGIQKHWHFWNLLFLRP